MEVIPQQLKSLKGRVHKFEKETTSFAQTLPGFKNLIGIKGIGALSAAILLSTIGDIDDFAKIGNLAAYLGIVPRVSQSNDQYLVGQYFLLRRKSCQDIPGPSMLLFLSMPQTPPRSPAPSPS